MQIGLAAPQICVSKQLIVVHVPADMYCPTPLKLALFNPKVKINGTKTFLNWESCISVPQYIGLVDRFDEIEVDFLDDKAQPRKIKTRGLYSGLLQHEIDHLNGLLYLWRMSSSSVKEKLFHLEEVTPDNPNVPKLKEPKSIFTLDWIKKQYQIVDSIYSTCMFTKWIWHPWWSCLATKDHTHHSLLLQLYKISTTAICIHTFWDLVASPSLLNCQIGKWCIHLSQLKQ